MPQSSPSPCGCTPQAALAAGDPGRRLSTHRTSRGAVTYYLCYCGRPMVTVAALR